MELYIHIPFCVQKCKYCDFLSFPVGNLPVEAYTEVCTDACSETYTAVGIMDRYLSALIKEIKSLEPSTFETIYFGGGTPSVFGVSRLISLLDVIKKNHYLPNDCEITVEINPATIDCDGLHNLYMSGFNRLSIGLQSTNNDELQMLGRIHSYEDFLETYQNARKAGFQNINIDLMSALPGQTLDEYLNSLHNVILLNPEHISSYSLIIEENTPFYNDYVNLKTICGKNLPSEEIDREMYHMTKQLLKDAGYSRYEISNYAKAGFHSRHNTGYWKRTPYYGCGLGASSFVNHIRYKNPSNMDTFLSYWESIHKSIQESSHETSQESIHETSQESFSYFEEYDILSKEDEMSEYMILGLRTSHGISIHDFEKEFSASLFDVFGKELESCAKADLANPLIVIDKEQDRIYLTDHGMDLSNWIFEKFI